jgi:hypothetical protein
MLPEGEDVSVVYAWSRKPEANTMAAGWILPQLVF